MPNTELNLRDRILEISRILVYEEGHQSLTMRKVAKLAGVTATSIYLYFQNRDELIHTLIEESVEELNRHIEQTAEAQTDTVKRVETITKAYVDFALANPEKYQIIYMIQGEDMARYPKEKFRKVRRGFQVLATTISEGVALGVMEVEDPVLAAYSIWGQLHGITSVVLSQRLDRRIETEKFIQESLNYIVQGFLIQTTIS
ncbi:MAG: TetR/AcrR family transcriptional regulator [Bacteroidota bacterium]